MNVLWRGAAFGGPKGWFHQKMDHPPVGWRLGPWWFFSG